MKTTTKQQPSLMQAATTLLLMVLMLAAAPQTAGAENVSYIDADGNAQTVTATALIGSETSLAAGWYFVGTNINHSGQITCTGDVNIILCDGYTMTINGNSDKHGINGGDNSLTIYGQTLGTGTLDVTGSSDVAIYAVDAVTINGGTINAAGIASDGNVTINGGKVTSNHDPGLLSNSGDIILGWTSLDDRITAESYSASTVKVADGRGLTDGTNSYSGTLSADDITAIAEKTLKPHWAGSGTSLSPYTISRPQELDLLAYRVNGTHGETYQSDGYRYTYFRLGADIAYTHSTDWDDANSTEDNYEAIGGYYAPNDCYFKGDFDGASHIISGIRIYRGGSDTNVDNYQGLFGQIQGANIHGIRLADARITGYDNTGGIVGYNNGTVTDCHVANNVCIHAAQTNAYKHGGIAGYTNSGTIRNCTSAATLTVPFNASCRQFGGIVGYNSGGTITDNLVIGAIVPAAAYDNHGAIVGANSNYGGTFLRNYYTACKVASENVTPSGVGCANEDVTANDGAVPALRDGASNAQAIALLAALSSTADSHIPVDLGWGAGKYPLQLAGRTLTKNGYWNTLCLPFDVTIADSPLTGATVKKLNTSSSYLTGGTLTLNFTDESTTMTAGTAYIIKWEGSSSIENPVFEGATITSTTPTADESTDGNVQFVGQYSPFGITADNINEILYVASGNKIGYSKSARTLKPFRAHFWVKPNGDTQAVRMINIDFGEGETTEISEIERMRNGENGQCYDLQGRRVANGQSLKKGLYINSGRKYVIK